LRKRSQPTSLMVFFGIAIIIAVAAGWFLARRSVDLPRTGVAVAGYEGPAMQKRQVHLYFGDSNGRYLTAEQRVVEEPADVVSAARSLVQALIQGPLHGGTRTLPQDSSLRSLFVTPEGVAYVDFKADAFEHHPGGVETEMLTIYSIVNTLVLNMEEIRWVKLLIGGQEAATLAGHVDLSHLFNADMLWVR
jgi:spore germination protein GerM